MVCSNALRHSNYWTIMYNTGVMYDTVDQLRQGAAMLARPRRGISRHAHSGRDAVIATPQ